MATHLSARATGRVTIVDVARQAGVSASTASLAFSGSGPVSAATRERVLAAASTLGYAGPDPLARSLRRGRCGVVAVLLGERLGYAFSDPMLVTILDGLAEQVGALGASLMLVPAHEDDPGRPDPVTGLPMDAAVLIDCGQPPERRLAALRSRGTLVVGIDGPVGAGIPLVTIDDEGATAAVVAHLAGLGHRRFGVVTLPSALDGDGPGVPRRRARSAREAIGLVPGATVRFAEATRNVVEEGERAAGALLDGAGSRSSGEAPGDSLRDSPGDSPADPVSRPTALIAQSDVLALGCLRAAVLRGLEVPGRLSVAGFDGVDLHLPDGTALTTVTQPAQQKGQAAGRLLAVALDGGHPDDVRLAAVLRVGTTTGPPPAFGT